MVRPPSPSSVPSTLAITPDSTATSGVPSAAKMSLPLCRREHPSRQACQSSVNDAGYGSGTGNALVTGGSENRGGGSYGRASAGAITVEEATRPAMDTAAAANRDPMRAEGKRPVGPPDHRSVNAPR